MKRFIGGVALAAIVMIAGCSTRSAEQTIVIPPDCPATVVVTKIPTDAITAIVSHGGIVTVSSTPEGFKLTTWDITLQEDDDHWGEMLSYEPSTCDPQQ